MRTKLFFLLFIALSLSSFVEIHKFYVSVTNVEYSEKEDALQITSRIFIDDLESVIKERYDIELNLATDDEVTDADDYVERYFQQKFAILLDGKIARHEFLGKKYENDVAVCFIEVSKTKLDQCNTLAIENDLLTDFFEEQKNIVHIKVKGNKKSFVLIKENNKGMLNL